MRDPGWPDDRPFEHDPDSGGVDLLAPPPKRDLGGKPTQAEARAAALEKLVPLALKSLAAHLGTGEASSWRAALRVFELSYGKPAETVELDLDAVDPLCTSPR